MKQIVRMGAQAAGIPVGAAMGAVHRLMTGQAVVMLTVKRVPDVMDRAMLLQRVRGLATDPCVKVVVLRVEGPPGNWAATEDFVSAVGDLRAAGKPVYALVESPGNAAMWIASAADRVFCVPTGELALVGVGVELTFFGAALERLGLQPDFEAAGAYKSFGEAWTRAYPSPENLEAMTGLVDGLNARLVSGIAAARGLEPEAVQAAIDAAPLSAQQAVDAGLVDELLYADQLKQWIEDTHGSDLKHIGFEGWATRDAARHTVAEWGTGAEVIAVLHLDGTIVMESDGGGVNIAARTVVPMLRALREDDEVAAVVLNVNSPGGHALASDLMWREIDEMARSKPVVACFEDVSASGGFYLSAPAKEIFVRPGTLTGSIGVVGGKLVAGKGLRSVGVHVHEVAASPNATLFSPNRRFTDDQRARFRGSLQRFYDGFVGRVAAGRGKEAEEVEPHCRGRVWTGEQARTRGLVDRVGDLDDAIARARELASLTPGRFVVQHQSGDARTWAQKQVAEAMKRVRPGAAMALADLWMPRPLRAMVEVAVQHQGQPLAMQGMHFEIT